MTVVIQHMSPKEIADLIPVDGLSPQDRKRAEATRAYLIDLVANPVDPSPLLKARVSGDPVQIEQAAVHYGIQLGLRARGFWLETIAGRKRLAGLVTSREEKGYLDAAVHGVHRPFLSSLPPREAPSIEPATTA